MLFRSILDHPVGDKEEGCGTTQKEVCYPAKNLNYHVNSPFRSNQDSIILEMESLVNLFLAFQIQAKLAVSLHFLAETGFRAELLAVPIVLCGGIGPVEGHDHTIADGVESALGLKPILSAGDPLSTLELDGSLEDRIIVRSEEHTSELQSH